MKCIEKIIQSKIDLKRYISSIKSGDVKVKKAKAATGVKFGPEAITPSMLLNLFTEKNGRNQQLREDIMEKSKEKTTIKDIVKNDKKIVPSFWKKLRGLVNLEPKYMTIFHNSDGSNDTITAIETIQRGIAFNHLSGSVKTEFDLMNKYNLSEEEHNQLMPPGEFLPSISAIGTAAAIGKEILMTQGLVLMPAKKGSKEFNERQMEVEKIYTDVGMKAIRLLGKDGFLTVEENSPVINERFRIPGGDSLSSSKLIEAKAIRFNMVKMLNLSDDSSNAKALDSLTKKDKFLIEKYLRKQASVSEINVIKDKFPTLYANTRGATYMHRLLVPTNSKGPETSYDEKNTGNHDVRVSKTTQDVLNEKRKGSLLIPSDLEKMFDFIYDEMEGRGISFEDAAKALGINEYKEMMGFSSDADSTSATRDSNMGKSLSKTTPIAEFFDNYAEFRKLPIHLQEEIKRNGRGHYMTTYMNPQTDKHFSRYIMQIPEYEVPAFDDGVMTDTFKHLLAGISDQAGKIYDKSGKDITIDAIMQPGLSPELDRLISNLDAVDRTKGENMFVFISKGFKKSPLAGSVWQQYDTAKAIHGVREMMASGDGKNMSFNGQFMPKPDGTASGAVIMAMQIAGKTDNTLYEALGLDASIKNEEKALRDAYDVVLNELKRKDTTTTESTKSEIQKTIDKLIETGVFKDIRDWAKFSSMTAMYKQGEESAIATVAEDITSPTYRKLERNKRNFELANEIKRWIQKSDEDLYSEIGNLTDKELVSSLLSENKSRRVYDAMLKYQRENVTSELYQIVQSKFVGKYLKEHQDFTNEAFSVMDKLSKASGDRISMISPEMLFDAVRRKTIKKHGSFDISKIEHLTDEEMMKLKKGKDSGIPLMKLFGTVNHPEKNSTVSNWEYPHEINAHVNIVHAMDFAILNEAFRRTFEEANDKTKSEALQKLDLVKNGTISIHDAISAHPEFSRAYEKHYRESARDMSAVYDIHDVLTFEMENMDGYKEYIEQPGSARTKELRKEAQKQRDKKVAKLVDMDYDSAKVFGFKEPKVGNLIFGHPVSTAQQKQEAKTKTEEDNKAFVDEQMLTSRISKADAKEEYDNVMTTMEDTHVVLDTETVGDDSTPANQVDPTLPYQVAFIKREKQADGTFKDVEYDFWFSHDVSKQVSGMKGLKENVKNQSKNVKKMRKQGLKNDIEVFEAMKKALGDTPIIAYNAEFDIESMKILYAKYNGSKRL